MVSCIHDVLELHPTASLSGLPSLRILPWQAKCHCRSPLLWLGSCWSYWIVALGQSTSVLLSLLLVRVVLWVWESQTGRCYGPQGLCSCLSPAPPPPTCTVLEGVNSHAVRVNVAWILPQLQIRYRRTELHKTRFIQPVQESVAELTAGC